MGKIGGRDWTQIYAIYGITEWQTLLFLLIHALVFSFLSVLFLVYFGTICASLQSLFPAALSAASARFAAGFAGAVTALSAVCLFFAAGNFLYSSAALQWETAQRMLGAVSDWSAVRQALDVGCGGRGILLNAVAKQLKKEGSSGRVVGLSQREGRAAAAATAATLRTAAMEGVQEYVTCREGDARRLPFPDNYFEVVVSGAFVHTVGREMGRRRAAAERTRVVTEVVRVLRPGGVGVVWDLRHVPEYVQRLTELRMEDITVSERVTAFMVGSHIVSFRKPRQQLPVVGPAEVRLDWRSGVCNIC